MDNNQLYEQVVPKERSPRHGLNVALILLGMIAIPTAIFTIAIVAHIPYLNIVAIFVFLFCIYFAWYFITSLNI